MPEEKENKRYLTEIKELPQNEPVNEVVEKEEKQSIPQPKPVQPIPEKKHEKTQKMKEPSATEKQKVEEIQVEETKKQIEEEKLEPVRQRKNQEERKLFSAKEIILGVVNFIALGGLVFLLLQLPNKAREVAEVRNEQLQATQKVAVKLAEIEDSKELAEEIKTVFPDESGLVDFVKGVEDIRIEGTVSDVSFRNQNAIKDKTGNLGLPVLITFRGEWPQVGQDMVKIQDLPFIFRAVSIESRFDEEGVLIVEYGGFLYTNERLGENR